MFDMTLVPIDTIGRGRIGELNPVLAVLHLIHTAADGVRHIRQRGRLEREVTVGIHHINHIHTERSGIHRLEHIGSVATQDLRRIIFLIPAIEETGIDGEALGLDTAVNTLHHTSGARKGKISISEMLSLAAVTGGDTNLNGLTDIIAHRQTDERPVFPQHIGFAGYMLDMPSVLRLEISRSSEVHIAAGVVIEEVSVLIKELQREPRLAL